MTSHPKVDTMDSTLITENPLAASTSGPKPSRRTFLKTSALSAVALAASANAQVARQGPPVHTFGMGKFALLERVNYGINRAELQRYHALGWSAYLEYQLNPAAIDDTDCERRMAAYQTLGMSPYQCLREIPEGVYPDWECIQGQITRAIYSKRQLQEMLTEFWMDHFNVYIYDLQRELLPAHIAAIRANCLGNFHTLLTAVTKSPAMLWYLDNLDNTKGNQNVNFAREFLELHTLGVDGGYTERDIKTVSRVFTGWGMDGYYDWPWDKTTNRNWGKFKYYNDLHDTSGGQFLGEGAGNLIATGGSVQGDTVIQIAATHPSTAKHICTKLIRRFVNYEAHPDLVNSASQVFLNNNGNIAAVLRHILEENRFKKYYGVRFKRPYHLVIGAQRNLNAEMTDPDSLVWELLWNMRQVPLFWLPPNGYPDDMSSWVDNMRPRWYYGSQFGMNWLWNSRANVFTTFQTRDKNTLLDAINIHLFGGRLPALRREQLAAYLPDRLTNDQIKEAFGLAMNCPEYQLH